METSHRYFCQSGLTDWPVFQISVEELRTIVKLRETCVLMASIPTLPTGPPKSLVEMLGFV